MGHMHPWSITASLKIWYSVSANSILLLCMLSFPPVNLCGASDFYTLINWISYWMETSFYPVIFHFTQACNLPKERLLCSVNQADGARGGLWKYIHVQPNLWRIFNLLLNHWNIFQSKVVCYWVFWIIHVTSSFSKSDQASAILVFLVVYFKGFWLLKSDEQLSCENQVPLKI